MHACNHVRETSPGWETKNWNAIYNSDKQLGEQIIKEASMCPEMTVIAQSAGLWAIRTIAEQRQKSTKRAAQQRTARTRSSQRIARAQPDTVRFEHDQVQQVQNLLSSPANEDADLELSPVELGTNTADGVANTENKRSNNDTERVPSICMAEEAVTAVKDLEGPENDDSSRHELFKPSKTCDTIEQEMSKSSALLEIITDNTHTATKDHNIGDIDDENKKDQSEADRVKKILQSLPQEKLTEMMATLIQSGPRTNAVKETQDSNTNSAASKKNKRKASNKLGCTRVGKNRKITGQVSKKQTGGKRNKK